MMQIRNMTSPGISSCEGLNILSSADELVLSSSRGLEEKEKEDPSTRETKKFSEETFLPEKLSVSICIDILFINDVSSTTTRKKM